MQHTKKLEVTRAKTEDVRHLLCRVHSETFDELGITKDKYLDAVIIRISNHGRTVSLLARTPVDEDSQEPKKEPIKPTIQLDEWSRFKLCARCGDNVTVQRGNLGDVVKYVWHAITKHPDITTRWQNIALAFAVFGLMVAFPGILYSVWADQSGGLFRTDQMMTRIVTTILVVLPMCGGIVAIWRSLPKH